MGLSMANSFRKRILDYLVSDVFTRITTDDGYNTDLQTIKRGILQIDSMPNSSFPALFVARANEDRNNITINQFKSIMRVVIVGYVKNKTGIDGLMSQIDNLIEDTTKAIEQDRTLGGNCKWLEVKQITTDDGDMMPFGAFAMVVEIAYDTGGVLP